MRRIDDALTAAGGLGMGRYFMVVMADPDPAAGNHDADCLADQPPRHAIGIGVELDRAIGLDPAYQLADLTERGAAAERLQRVRLSTLKALDRWFSGRAVHPLVGDLALPPSQVRFQRSPADKVVAGDGIVLDVADPALVLGFGARAVGSAGPWPEAQKPAKACSR